ncbi:hypothetical protein MAR_021492 [Mya arenaria]|uniref:Lnb N-terminal periplasmic domain-containing protein n=1 Tax=Mya arenaria TaxID=6604 RepID=A0ABY7E7U7_MYAAR|nr:uncharacterized protein LOC128234883 [Mya arenaria]WAR06123.1 hypothetical protein MAR_021492 [Mya arenaria]
MVLFVYKWDGDGVNTRGHVALGLPGGTYISWWPSRKVIDMTVTGVKADEDRTYVQDRENFEGLVPKMYSIDTTHQQESDVKSWWEKFKSENDTYHLLNCNCSTVAFKALSVIYPDIAKWHSIKEVWTPSDIERVVQRLITLEYKELAISCELDNLNIRPDLETSFVLVQHRSKSKKNVNGKKWWYEKKKRTGLLYILTQCITVDVRD